MDEERASDELKPDDLRRTDDPYEFEVSPDEIVDVCPNCLQCFKQNPLGRRKVYCCRKCRIEWNHKYADPKTRPDLTRTVVCQVCGKEFTAVREYGKIRKYCSHACSNRGRAAKRRGEL